MKSQALFEISFSNEINDLYFISNLLILDVYGNRTNLKSQALFEFIFCEESSTYSNRFVSA
jgi:hypothetical protein